MNLATHVMPVHALHSLVPARVTQSRQMANAVERRFQESPYRSIRMLQCEHRGEALILRGRLPTLHLKQLAQSIALRVPGVAVIHDSIEIDHQPVGRRIGCLLPR